jgi:ABC-type transport system substrate-binding protein
VEAAKRLLADAGFNASKPLETNLLFPNEGYGYSGGDDIQDAIATMWRAAGVKVNYVTLDPARRRQLTDAQQLWNHIVLGGSSSDTWTGITTYGSAQGTARGVGVEVPEADTLLGRIRQTLDTEEQDRVWREAGRIFYDQHREIPLFWIPVEATVDPKVVADYYYPGAITGAWTHVYNLKAVK